MTQTSESPARDSESHQFRRLCSLVAAVSHVMISARSKDHLFQPICQKLTHEGGLSLAWIGSLNLVGTISRLEACAGIPVESSNSTLTLAAEDLGKNEWVINAIGKKKPTFYKNPASIPESRIFNSQVGPEDLRSVAAFPLLVNGSATHVLTVYSKDADFFDSATSSLLTQLTSDLGLCLERLDEAEKIKKSLSEEDSLLQALMKNLPDDIYFKDANSRFIQASDSMCRRFGTTPKDITGKSDFDFFAPSHAEEAMRDERQIMSTGQPLIGKVEKESWANGQCSWALTTKVPFHNKTGQIIGTLGISKDFTDIKKAEDRLEEVHRQLVEASRIAGMAEVATSVLHNVGNVLNSVNISCSLVTEKLRSSKANNLAKVGQLLEEIGERHPELYANEPKAKHIPGYLQELTRHLSQEREEAQAELASLSANIHHIREIVSVQQDYARLNNTTEPVLVCNMIEDAIRLNAGAIQRHEIQITREFATLPPLVTDRHRVLQILVNLLQNAKYALDDGHAQERRIVIRLEESDNKSQKISIIDNGVGIPTENLTRIFEHGFTTRKNGHGFGLHSGALAARQLGGCLTAQSEGLGRGATFVLILPNKPADLPL